MGIGGWSASNYLTVAAPVTAAPFTFSILARFIDFTSRGVFSIGDTAVNTNRWTITGLTSGTALIRNTCNDTSGAVTADAAMTPTTGVWYQITLVVASPTSRIIYVNGGSAGTNTTSRTPTSVDLLGIGILAGSSFATPMNGYLANAGFWNVALSADEVASLYSSAGVFKAPPHVQVENLRSYWRLSNVDNLLIDSMGNANLTLTGSLTTFSEMLTVAEREATARVTTYRESAGLIVHEIPWMSDYTGGVDIWMDRQGLDVSGIIDRVITTPSTAMAPTDNYDIALYDERNFDVLLGAGANRDTANVETAHVADALGTAHYADMASVGPLKLSITNCGAYKAGILRIVTRPIRKG